MLFAEQLRAARALLDWNQELLAEKSDVGIATIRRMEAQRGPIRASSDRVWRLQEVLEEAGVIFIPYDEETGPGVRLKKRP